MIQAPKNAVYPRTNLWRRRMIESRYHAQGTEAEFEPGSRGRVLRNKLGITRVRDIQKAESEALLKAHESAAGHFHASHRFTAQDICWLHRQWLGGLYPWAGEYRAVNVSKGGFMFAAAGQIPRLVRELEAKELSEWTPCARMDDRRLAEALARTHAELVIIHPFREGNGRCARLLAWLMGLQAGYPTLDFSPMAGRGKSGYVAAIHAAVAGDYDPMQRCFNRVLQRTWRTFPRPA